MNTVIKKKARKKTINEDIKLVCLETFFFLYESFFLLFFSFFFYSFLYVLTRSLIPRSDYYFAHLAI